MCILIFSSCTTKQKCLCMFPEKEIIKNEIDFHQSFASKDVEIPMVESWIDTGFPHHMKLGKEHIASFMLHLDTKDTIKKSACSGNPAGMTLLADEYVSFEELMSKGKLPLNQVKIGICWLEKAAKKNDIIGMCRLAYLYSKSIFFDRDHKKAFMLYKKAFDLSGSTIAGSNLAVMYFYGRGVTRNYKKCLDILLSLPKDEYIDKMINYINEGNFLRKE